MILEIIENIMTEKEKFLKKSKENDQELDKLYNENQFLRMHVSKKIV